MLTTRAARQEAHESLILHPGTPAHRLGIDVDVPSFHYFILSHLSDMVFGPYVERIPELGGELFAFCLEIRISHPARLRSKIKLAFTSPKKSMGDFRMGGRSEEHTSE